MKLFERKEGPSVESAVAQFPVNCVRICLNQENPEPQGCICAVSLEQDIPFCGRRELIVGIDEAFDRIGQPQPHQVIRSFRPVDKNYKSYNGRPERYHSSEEIHARSGSIRTLDLIMISRRHAEWQGMIKDTDGNVLHRFVSSLDFLEWLSKV